MSHGFDNELKIQEVAQRTIGSGRSGATCLALMAGRVVAVKSVPRENLELVGELKNEVSVYAQLRDLQGVCVPTFQGSGYVGSRIALATDYIGESMSSMSCCTRLFDSSREALRRFHEAGFVHGDVRLANFVVAPDGKVFVIDFAFSYRQKTQEDEREQTSEMRQLFELFDWSVESKLLNPFDSPARVLVSSPN
jgi:serine/threonine protein kinase